MGESVFLLAKAPCLMPYFKYKMFLSAESFEVQDAVMKEINELRSEFDSMRQIVQIRQTINR
ncbi:MULTISPECIES: hypothetical protein [Bacillaceae]|uniref:hypothetical protein n=1 Tax=Bacillaceae TaxID=186817 RepID=UPI000C776FB9|nr:hypothetical protein [Bacillus infantis]MCK6206338.1 hypothetical protein [Bacillus infantis]MDW2876809.1 hypothetical protein [Bacillus infantis]PLR74221.1 hypothetical protein CYJ37_00885 [Bacillus sp. UMB0728]